MSFPSKKKGSIVYIGGFELPDKNAAAHRVVQNGKILSSLGYEVVFCGVDRSIDKTYDEINEIDGFRSSPAKYPSGFFEWLHNQINFSHIEYVLKSTHNLKIVIAYNMHAIPLKRLIKYCKKNSIKIVADITEWYENKLSFNPSKILRFFDTNLVMEKFHKKVDGIIAISDYLEAYYSKSVSSIINLPPLVDSKSKIWHQSIYYKSKVEFVYAGLPGRDKDKLDIIIECFLKRSTKDYILNIVGLTKEQFLNAHPCFLEKLEKFEDAIFFYGKIEHNKAIRLLLQSDCSIFIRERSRKNMAGFPTKFVEAVTAGTGVIANDVSNIKKYASPNIIIIDAIEPSLLTMAIDKTIRQGKIVHRISDIFDFRLYTHSVEIFIDKLLSNSDT